MELTVSELVKLLDASAYNMTPSVENGTVHVQLDSRKVESQDVFWALKGERFDGHEYVQDSLAKGCAVAVVDQQWYKAKGNAIHEPLIVVEDSSRALLELGKQYAAQFDIPIVGLTGSNGKTTTKDMLVHVLSSQGSTLGTMGNFNNQVGVPLTLFRLESTHRYAVVEMGTNHPGEIGLLSSHVNPDVVLITNIGHSHMEFFKSLENVLEEKWSIVQGLKNNGIVVVNGEDPYLQKKLNTAEEEGLSCMSYGVRMGDWHGVEVNFDERGCASFKVHSTAQDREVGTVQLKVPGKHNVYNALGVFSVASHLGIPEKDIAERLSSFTGSSMRMEIKRVGDYHLLEDCYNANPSSMASALNVLKLYQQGNRKIAFLGDMAELGESSERNHREVGANVVRHSVNKLIACGAFSEYYAAGAKEAGMSFEDIHTFSTAEEGMGFLKDVLETEDVLLLKGSRSAKLEVVASFLHEVVKAEELK